jgi:hypothetical protein
MPPPRRRPAVALVHLPLLTLVVLMAGCVGETVSNPVESDESELRVSSSGVLVPEEAMRRGARRLAQALAVAMTDASVRQSVHAAIGGSPYREYKVAFGDLVLARGAFSSTGPVIKEALQNAMGSSLVAAILDSIVDLEFYMPVKGHLTAWTGGPEVVVATALRDHELPVGFAVGGAPVAFSSAYEPPSSPVLAIVPREGPFTVRPPILSDCDPATAIEPCEEDPGTGGGNWVPTEPGLWMTFSYIPGNYEGFMMGDPEFEVFLASRTSSTEQFNREIQCAGEHAANINVNQPGIRSPEFVYDQNTSHWLGAVQVATLEQLEAAQASDSASMLMIWEDDNDPCRIRKGEADTRALIAAASSVANAGRAFLKCSQSVSGQCWQSGISAAAMLVLLITLWENLQSDDPVGVLVKADQVGQSWEDATHAIINSNGQVAGRVKLTLVPRP